MGGGSYSFENRAIRSSAMGYDTKPMHEIFTQVNINNAMSPHGVQIRESRDSAEHPNSVAIIVGLDVTGSMLTVPHYLVRTGLPHMMNSIIQKGIADPQVLFMGIGDHECDRAPLQIGQFESSDELLDKWLTTLFLEGGGGGNAGESYLLAWYFAARHTSIDCFEKRKQKGILFTIGDEPALTKIPKDVLKAIMGPGEYSDGIASTLLSMAQEKYEVFHIHIHETGSGSRQFVIDGWKQRLQDHLVVADHKEDVADIITDTVMRVYSTDLSVLKGEGKPEEKKEQEIIL